MKKEFNILDLFAGCGGLSQGFREAGGFSVPFANEYWKPAQDSYEASHPETKLFREDIRELTNDKINEELLNKGIKKIDLIIGGPPCQGFSMAGARRIDDPRNKLFLEFVRLVAHLEPKFFVFENVKGLLTMKNGNGEKVIDKIVEEFKAVDGGYNLRYKLLNSADYGVPQERERIILIGTRLDMNGDKLHPLPTHAPLGNFKGLKKWFDRNGGYFFGLSRGQIHAIRNSVSIDDFPNYAMKILSKMKPHTTVLSAIHDLEKVVDKNDLINHKSMNHTDIVKRRMQLIPEGKNIPVDQSSWPEELKRKKFASVYKRLDRNKPACTMVPGHSAFPIHYNQNRSLSVREAARIQTLPDNFKFFGSKTEQCLVVGNAVPSLMAKAIAKKIKKILEEKEYS